MLSLCLLSFVPCHGRQREPVKKSQLLASPVMIYDLLRDPIRCGLLENQFTPEFCFPAASWRKHASA